MDKPRVHQSSVEEVLVYKELCLSFSLHVNFALWLCGALAQRRRGVD